LRDNNIMNKNPLVGMKIPNDDIYLQWLKLSKFSKPIKDLFDQLPNIWQEYIETDNNERLIWFTNQLLEMKKENGNSIDFLPNTLRENASDCFILLKQYDYALEFIPIPILGSTNSFGTDRLLSLKYATKKRISGSDILTLFGPKVTKFGKEHLDAILKNLDTLIDKFISTTNVDIIPDWVKDSKLWWCKVGNGSPLGYFLTKKVELDICRFSINPQVLIFVKNFTREAENMVREQMGIPKVGEGWIGETVLYYENKKAYPNLTVQQHAKPKWLGRQHLDVFLPEINVALEYQGVQHEHPIEYFGGQDSFELNIKRDLRKYRLCRRHKIKLIYVHPSYDLKSIIQEIEI
jgi:hypothetical protein